MTREKHNGVTFLAGLGRSFCVDACCLKKNDDGAEKNANAK